MWVPLLSVSITRDWQFSPPVEAVKFRLRYSYPLGWFPRGVICQASTSLPREMSDYRRFFGKSQHDVFEFVQPNEFVERSIAVKGTRYPEILSVDVDYWDGSQALPVSYALAYSEVPVILASGNPRRQEITIRNASDRSLYLGLGGVVSLTDYFVQLPPGALCGLPESWQGLVTGVWAAGGSGEAVIKEFL
jgi:hypothetical protein